MAKKVPYEVLSYRGVPVWAGLARDADHAMKQWRESKDGPGFPNGALYDGKYAARRAVPAGEAGVESLTIDWEPVPTRRVLLPWQKAGLSYTRTGYGPRIPTVNQVWYGGRWRRVYVCIWSNSGTCFIGRNISTGKVVR